MSLRKNISIIVTAITIVSSILVGGIAFGELRGGMMNLKDRVDKSEARVLNIEHNINKIDAKLTKVCTDIEWLRYYMERERAELRRSSREAEELALNRGR